MHARPIGKFPRLKLEGPSESVRRKGRRTRFAELFDEPGELSADGGVFHDTLASQADTRRKCA